MPSQAEALNATMATATSSHPAGRPARRRSTRARPSDAAGDEQKRELARLLEETRREQEEISAILHRLEERFL